VTRPATCASCRFWTHTEGEGWYTIGTCAKGGPTPDDGCSDTHRDEVCERYEGKEQPK
jgi:hypothetical protein